MKFELDLGKRLGKSTPNPDLGKSCEFPYYPWHLPELNDKYCVYWLIAYQSGLIIGGLIISGLFLKLSCCMAHQIVCCVFCRKDSFSAKKYPFDI